MGRSTSNGCKPFKAMIWWRLSTIWTRSVTSLFFYSSLNPSQALDSLDPASTAFRKCLRELRHVCGAKTILPPSCTLSSQSLTVGRQPVASGGSGDVYEGWLLDGSKVCVKRVRIYSKDGPEKATKVRPRPHHFPIYHR